MLGNSLFFFLMSSVIAFNGASVWEQGRVECGRGDF
jgi:hypothetical protein